MKLKRLIAVFMCLVMVFAVLTSCNNETAPKELTPEEMYDKAAENLLKVPYVATMTMDYSSDNEEVNSVFESMSGMELKINMDGTNFSMDMEMMGITVNYICVDNVLYMEMMGMKVKSELTDEQMKEFSGDYTGSSFTGVSLDDFNTVNSVKNEDGSYTITCKGLKGDGADLIDSVLGNVGTDEASVTIDKENLEYVFVIDKDCNYKSITASMSMNVEVDELGVVSVDATVKTETDFANGQKVTAPANADEYTEMPAEELIG